MHSPTVDVWFDRSIAAETMQAKPAATAEGATNMSQQAANQASAKKAGGEDSLSPFSSDEEDAKRKYYACMTENFI